MNVLLSFVVAPFLGILITAPIFAASIGEFETWGLVFFFGLFASYGCAAVFGLPLFLVWRTLRLKLGRGLCALSGLIVSMPAMSYALLTAKTADAAGRLPFVIALFGATGVLSGLAFWFVYQRLSLEAGE